MKVFFLALTCMFTAAGYFYSYPKNKQVYSDTTVYIPPVGNATRTSDYLFPVAIDNKVGFIDASGNLIIPAIYEAAQEFSEGMCAVRYGGLYGFISPDGAMAIKPAYDYATQFHEGLALVYVKSNPCFIDTSGKIVIRPHYAAMSHFDNGRSFVKTSTKKIGIINREGKLVIDTIYQSITDFTDGFAIVEGIGHEPFGTEDAPRNLRTAVIDTLGNILIPFGTFQEILGPYEKHFIATYPAKTNNDDYNRDVIINSKGKVLHYFGKHDLNWSKAKINNGIFRISRHKGNDVNTRNHDVYITVTGKTVYSNKRIEYGKDFSEGFAFWQDDSRTYHLINRKGKIIGKYDDLIGDGFKNGLAIVKTNNLWGIIDTMATFVVAPKFTGISEGGIHNGIFYTYDSDNHTYGVADIHGKTIIPPSFEFFDTRGFVNGLLKTRIDNQVTFFNKEGSVVWQSDTLMNKEPQAYNIDFMHRGYFYARHEITGHPIGLVAEPQKLSFSDDFPDAEFNLIVKPQIDTVINNRLKGIKAFIVNATNDTINFNAQDGRLCLKMQALDSEKQWRDIEYLPSSWCGNSYHVIRLPNGYFWEFGTLVYQGSIQTKLRLELTYVDPADTAGLQRSDKGHIRDRQYRDRKEIIIYSNEFDGSINPGQFWRKPDYTPLNIMDPYND